MKKAGFPKKPSLKKKKLSKPNLSLSWPSLKPLAIASPVNSRITSHLPYLIPTDNRANFAQHFCYDQGRPTVGDVAMDRSIRWNDLIVVRAGGESRIGSVTHE